MAGSLNKVIIIGRLGQDPKISYTQNGSPVANLSVATDEGWRDKQSGERVERTEWHRVVAFRQPAEFAGKYLSKGRLVMVEGKLQTRKWQDQNGQDRYTTEIIADRLDGLDKPSGDNQYQGGGYQQQPQQQYQGGGQQQYRQNQGGGHQDGPQDEDLGPAFPSEASGMDDVPF